MENKKELAIKVFNFNEAYVPPVSKYNFNKDLIEWGDKNLYPNYLLQMYNYTGSATHKAIINKKTKLIAGKGFNDILSPELKDFVKENNLELEVKKAALDYEIFNGFAFEIIYDNEGVNITSLSHMPFHKLRIGIQDKEEINYPFFWFSNNWEECRKEMYKPVPIRAYNKLLKQGKQIFYYSEYNPSCDGAYPIAGYSTSMNWIELDFEISQFHLNQAKQGYSPSFILNFATGIPQQEEQDDFYRHFKKNYSGTKNSGKIIITYSEGEEQAPELIPIALNDSDERFIMLMDQVETQIVRGAEIPPQLVILTPGKLGSSDERSELMAEFQNSYVQPRMNNIEFVLNQILSNVGFKEELKLKNYLSE